MTFTRRFLDFSFCAFLGVCSVALPRQALAAITDGTSITITNSGQLGGVGGGGAFLITSGGADSPFTTFCLEFNEHISNNGTYIATVNNGAIGGGESGQTGGVGGMNYDPLSSTTRWLYGEYATGNLATAASGSGYVAGNSNWTSALQLVIWRFEGEANVFGTGTSQAWKDFNGGTLLASYTTTPGSVYQDATNLWNWVNSHGSIVSADADHVEGNVNVLNLWNNGLTSQQTAAFGSLDLQTSAGDAARSLLFPSKAAQSQLYYSPPENAPPPTPEPGTLVLWGGLALGGLVMARQRRLALAS